MFTISQNRPDSKKKSRRRVAKSTYTGTIGFHWSQSVLYVSLFTDAAGTTRISHEILNVWIMMPEYFSKSCKILVENLKRAAATHFPRRYEHDE
jgi:hypothetical protein